MLRLDGGCVAKGSTTAQVRTSGRSQESRGDSLRAITSLSLIRRRATAGKVPKTCWERFCRSGCVGNCTPASGMYRSAIPGNMSRIIRPDRKGCYGEMSDTIRGDFSKMKVQVAHIVTDPDEQLRQCPVVWTLRPLLQRLIITQSVSCCDGRIPAR